MTNKQYLISIAVFVVLASVAALAIRGCRENKTVVLTPIEHTRDSVNAFHKDAERVIDSLIVIARGQQKAKDSLKAIKDKQEVELYQKGARIAYLVRQAQLQAQYKDTGALVQTVDTLLPYIQSVTEQAQNYLNQNRLLQNSYDSLLSTNSLQISKLDYEKSVLKDNFDKVVVNGISLEKQNAKLSKPKRIALVLGGGYTTDGVKLRPGAFAGIAYTLVKF